MKPVEQTRFGKEGNCHAACVASIFEVSIDEVPSPTPNELATLEGWAGYLVRLHEEFLYSRGFYAAQFGAVHEPSAEVFKPPFWSILAVETWDGSGKHALVCYDGEVVWNPHPSGISDANKPIDWTIFVAVNPASF